MKNQPRINKALFWFIFFITIAVIALASCTTERKCARKYPPQIITKDSLVYIPRLVPFAVHDTVWLPADTVKVTDSVEIVNGIANSKKVISETEFALAWAQVKDSKLLLELIQKDTAITRLIKGSVQTTDKESYHTETIIEKEFINHWYDKIARWIAVFAIAFFAFKLFAFFSTLTLKP